tara:strand:- start:32755 stop:33705 length:951 start_codon:yes stop_codon:yes gene_type:complete
LLQKKIKYGVIGVGHLGNFHVKQLLNIGSVELIGVYDEDPKRLNEISQNYNVPKIKAIKDLLKLADAVSIVTPTTTHKDIALLALDNDCHIFIEKPITHDLDSARCVESKVKKLQKVAHVGHIERFNPVIKKFNEEIHKPLFLECHRLSKLSNRSMDISVILDLMIHDIDLVIHMIDSPVKNIIADGVNVVSNSIDLANVKLSFENGCVVNLTASRISDKNMRKIRMFENNCYTSLDLLNHKLSKHYAKFSQENNQLNLENKQIAVNQYDALKEELQYFCNAINANNIDFSNIDFSIRSLEIALEINNIIQSKLNQ